MAREKKTKKSKLRTLDDVILIAIGPHVWGKGKTVDEALLKASRPKQYVVYMCHVNSDVDQVSGGILFPLDFPPREILRKGVPAAEGKKEKAEKTGA